MAYYRCAIMEIETKFNVLNQEFSLALDRNPINSIKSRLKSIPSMRDKLSRRGLQMSVDSIEQNLSDVADCAVIMSISRLATVCLRATTPKFWRVLWIFWQRNNTIKKKSRALLFFVLSF